MGRRSLGIALAAGLAAVAVVATAGGGPHPSPAPAPAGSVTVHTAPATPEGPSGRFLPTWLPADMRVRVEQEWAGGPTHGPGWTRTYVRRGPFAGDQDVLTISLEEGARPLDVDAEVARYAGARRTAVQGSPALLLSQVAARHGAALMWSPAPGRLAQVLGSGVSEEELAGTAEGVLPPPRLDATPVPEGFTELQRSDERAFPAAVPRHYAIGTLPLRGGARPEGTPSVQVIAAWGATVPDAGDALPVRGRAGVVTREARETMLTWSERPGLVVSVAGKNIHLDDVRRIASELRELSMAEVLGRATGAPVVLASGELGGTPYELRAGSAASGMCLELVHGWVSRRCNAEPGQLVVDFGGAISQGVAYGSVPVDATAVRLDLDGARAVETPAIGHEAGLGTAFYVVGVPPDARLVAVVALGRDGKVLRRTPVG